MQNVCGGEEAHFSIHVYEQMRFGVASYFGPENSSLSHHISYKWRHRIHYINMKIYPAEWNTLTTYNIHVSLKRYKCRKIHSTSSILELNAYHTEWTRVIGATFVDSLLVRAKGSWQRHSILFIEQAWIQSHTWIQVNESVFELFINVMWVCRSD